MKKHMTTIVLITVLTAAAAFFAGMKYQQSKGQSLNRGQFMQRNGNGNGARAGGRSVTGEILSKDETSITVKMVDGSSKIILISQTTGINKASEGTVDDLKAGEKVAVFGKENSDGSITAENIQLNPQFRGRNPAGAL